MSNVAVPRAWPALRPRWPLSLGLGLSLSLGLCVGTAYAQATASLAAGLQACAALAEPVARLACFDALATQSLGHAGSATAPGTAQAQAQTQAQAQARFGAPVPPSAEPDSLESHITGDFDGWEPGSVFRLANGQRWRVADGTRGVLIARDPRIVIRRAAMGSFLLEFVGQNRAVRVRRVD